MLSYQINGKGKTTVLLLHGYCEDSRMWEHFMRGLSSDYRILRIDLPGFGKSKISGKVSISEMAESVKEVIGHLKIKKFIFVGHSMGGYVGLEFAKQFPKDLNGLCIFHSHAFADTEQMKKARLISAKSIETGDQCAYVRRLLSMLFAEGEKNQKILEKMVARAEKYSKEGLINGQLAMGERADNSHVLEEINCPVQFIAGTNDIAVSPEFNRAQIHLPQVADIQILQGLGHMGMFTAPRRTKQMLKKFLQICEEFA